MHIMLLLICLFPSGNLAKQKWIDPHEMRYDTHEHWEDTEAANSALTCPKCSNENSEFAVYYKRLISLFVSSLSRDYTDSTLFTGYVTINLDVEDYNFLREFSKSGSSSSDKLRKVDSILSNIFAKSVKDHMYDTAISFTDLFYITFFNPTTTVLLLCSAAVYVAYKLIRTNFSLGFVIKIILLLGWIVDLWFTWVDLIQQEEIKRMAESHKYDYSQIPKECKTNEMNVLWALFYRTVYPNECRDYYMAKLKDNFYSVGPITVVAHQLGNFVVAPASKFGNAFGSYSQGILDKIPWPINYLLLPIILIFALLVLAISLSFITNSRFSFNLLHLLQLQFGQEQIRAAPTGNIDEHVYRRLIEDVHNEVQDRLSIEKPRNRKKKIKAIKAKASTSADNNDSDSEDTFASASSQEEQ